MSEQEKKTKGLIFAILTNFIDSPDRAIAATDSIYHNAVVPHGNSRELEGRIDEMDKTLDGVLGETWVHPSPDAEGPIRVESDHVVHYTNQRKFELESQKEKTNE